MRVVHFILVKISQLTKICLFKRLESMSHTYGLSLVTSPTAPDRSSPRIMTSELTTSECGPGYYYGQGSGKGQSGSQSYEWNLQTSTVAWLDRRLAVGGFTEPSVPGTWHRLAIVVPSAVVAVERLFAPGGINYDTG